MAQGHRKKKTVLKKLRSSRTGSEKARVARSPPPPPPVRGSGVKKKKVKRWLRDEDYIPPPLNNDDGDEIESFMIEPDEAEEHKQRSKRAKLFEEPDVKSVRFSEVKNGAPTFGESLHVGFKTRNNKGRKHKHLAKSRRFKKEDNDIAEEDSEPLVTNVDDDNIIEWDSNTVDEDPAPIHEFFCRNCDEKILNKYIKYFYKLEGPERIKVKGPFCSKMCSLEYNE